MWAQLIEMRLKEGRDTVMEPSGDRFTEYWKLGIVVMGWYSVVVVFLVPLIWPL